MFFCEGLQMARFDVFQVCFYIYLIVMQYSTCCLTYADPFKIVRMYVYKQQTFTNQTFIHNTFQYKWTKTSAERRDKSDYKGKRDKALTLCRALRQMNFPPGHIEPWRSKRQIGYG